MLVRYGFRRFGAPNNSSICVLFCCPTCNFCTWLCVNQTPCTPFCVQAISEAEATSNDAIAKIILFVIFLLVNLLSMYLVYIVNMICLS